MTTTRAGFLASVPLLAATMQSAAAQGAPLRIGTLLTDSYAEPYDADDRGFFAKAGLTAQISSFRNGGEIATAIVGGALDVGLSSPLSLANAHLRGIPLQYIAAGSLYSASAPTIGLCVAKASPFKTAKDLEGKIVSVTGLKDPTHLALLAWLAKNGADASTITITEIPTVEAGESVARGTIAAAILAEPSLSAAIAAGQVRLFGKTFDAVGNGILLSGWFVTADWAQRNAALAKRLVGAIYQTARWANANRALSGAILEKHTKISEATLRMMTRVVYAERLEPAMIDPILDLAVTYKFLERPVRATDLIVKLV